MAGESAMRIASDLGEPSYELAALRNLAVAYAQAGRYDQAIDACHRRIELSRMLGDVRGEALSLAILGDAFCGMGVNDAAVRCLNLALPVFHEHHAYRLYAICLLKLGHAYQEMGKCEEAISYLEESVSRLKGLHLYGRANVGQHALDRCRAGEPDVWQGRQALVHGRQSAVPVAHQGSAAASEISAGAGRRRG